MGCRLPLSSLPLIPRPGDGVGSRFHHSLEGESLGTSPLEQPGLCDLHKYFCRFKGRGGVHGRWLAHIVSCGRALRRTSRRTAG